MIVIADSGSTKTAWIVKDGERFMSFNSIGLNPFFVNSQKVANVVAETFKDISVQQVEKIFFYGAGCSSPNRCSIISNGLATFFTNAYIETNHDMLGAARGLFGNDNGIAIILGTGSNSCIYDGKNIIENIPALGYILGDEGSGAFFGLQLVKDFLNHEMPQSLSEKFRKTYNLEKESIFECVYNQQFPNRYLAKFAPFLSENISHAYSYKMVYAGLELFFKRHVIAYPTHKQYAIGSIGSIGFIFHDILLKICKKYNMELAINEHSPMQKLLTFHT